MSRLTANLLLLLAALIWGAAFVAQSTAMRHLGPYAFVGVRFGLSALVVLPFAMREWRRLALKPDRATYIYMALTAVTFFLGSILQQVAMKSTSVTNAGFLTGLYVVMAPFLTWLILRKLPHFIIWPASLLSLAGTWLLGEGSAGSLTFGDYLVIASALFWALQIIFLGLAAIRSAAPVSIVFVQFLFTAIVSLAICFLAEPLSWPAVRAAGFELLYAGVISGGIGFTLQALGQRHTPPADAAVILSAESLFAAIAGGLLLGERLDLAGWFGCAMILTAVMAVQLAPLLRRRPLIMETGT